MSTDSLTGRRDFLKQATTIPIAGYAANIGRAIAADAPVIAETVYGKVQGVDAQGIKTFKGIPYGASTAGSNRFTGPKEPAKWTGIREALRYGESAPQREPGAAPGNGAAVSTENLPAEGENCLVLNVWTPAVNDGRKRPVMVWLHGGGFATGSGSAPGYDGTNLSRRGDVVVITINHRLNVLGHLFLADVAGKEFAESGCAGILDIVQALKWVKANAAQFGGDAGNVTIFGQSGGGRKVEALLTMPVAKGLFHRAIIESGAAVKLVDRSQANKMAELLLAQLKIGKADARKLQNVPLNQIMSAYFAAMKSLPSADTVSAGFSPAVDGTLIPQHPFEPAASAISASVPVMIGSTRTEMTFGQLGNPKPFQVDEAGLKAEVQKLLGSNAGATVTAYSKANPTASPTDIYWLIASDFRYSAPTAVIAQRRAALKAGPVYLYYFTWETPVQGGALKSPHTIEIPFAFDNVKVSARLTGGGAEAMALADKVSDTWIAFARTGNPNNKKIPNWPAYDTANRYTMVINNELKVAKDPIREQRLAMFAAMNYS